MRRSFAKIPHSNATIKPVNKRIIGGSSFLLDGGLGGQSSYYGIDDYAQTTGRDISKPIEYRVPKGQGLSDKIGASLSRLNINKKPKKKNITMNF